MGCSDVCVKTTTISLARHLRPLRFFLYSFLNASPTDLAKFGGFVKWLYIYVYSLLFRTGLSNNERCRILRWIKLGTVLGSAFVFRPVLGGAITKQMVEMKPKISRKYLLIIWFSHGPYGSLFEHIYLYADIVAVWKFYICFVIWALYLYCIVYTVYCIRVDSSMKNVQYICLLYGTYTLYSKVGQLLFLKKSASLFFC